MFRFHKTLDIVTLFHKAGSPASVRAAAVLKQASANATEAATQDQASDHAHRSDFELNITEEPPTTDQLQTILGYVGKGKISSIVKGATSENEALKKFKESSDNFTRPVIVDWNNGRALASDKESEILKMLDQLNGK
ncbi:DUF1687-domain-containing protein [Xylaria cf. heliscus]|nr:DUF1687-domain-containing protein [Xylaria cf. heliscus]